MRIHLGANFQGYQAARELRDRLAAVGIDVNWLAAEEFDDNDDYPAISIRVAQAVVSDEDHGVYSRGIVVGGDGTGETIASNKVAGARAIPALSSDFVSAGRQHSDANVLILPSAWLSAAEQDSLIAVFIDTPFSNHRDDARRLINTAEFETAGTIEGWTVDEGKITSIPADPSDTGKFDSQRPGAAEAARAD